MPNAVVLTRYGPPDVLVWRDVPMPEPGPRQVRIRVQCAGVSPTDPKIRRGDVQAVFRLPADAVLGFAVPRVFLLEGVDVLAEDEVRVGGHPLDRLPHLRLDGGVLGLQINER